MTKAPDPTDPKRSDRDEKLAQALRANLRRRKAGTDKSPRVSSERPPPKAS